MALQTDSLDWTVLCYNCVIFKIVLYWSPVHVCLCVRCVFFSPGWQDTFSAGNPDVSSTHLSAAAGARGRHHRPRQTKQVRDISPDGACLWYGWQIPHLITASLLCLQKAAFDRWWRLLIFKATLLFCRFPCSDIFWHLVTEIKKIEKKYSWKDININHSAKTTIESLFKACQAGNNYPFFK